MTNKKNTETDVFHIKNKNAHSGMTYNEVKEYIARTTGGHDTKKYSNTDVNEVKAEIAPKHTESNPY
ncbi:gamma-type small acid-soluble spore protein [Pontibacillus sp. HMF3514]|uniref:gamma-type small acid-soluble spore protein n=1 Tax=Pontibacillus sp. HMF3514 TaxID=2692425 RepID=UPI00131FC179|nr:gamma-type small acid-soluble spore protein [Pontibacillus sp. HMF3514]QHE53984.1 gamma-type small acid-soluble spore protein [Pontibacillus sp. HMF3514]